METISVSKLKAQLSSELRKVKKGQSIIILDHKHPVAKIVPLQEEELFIQEVPNTYVPKTVKALIPNLKPGDLDIDREERW